MNNKTVGQEMYDFCRTIFPYCRSITGDGVRSTLSTINSAISTQWGGVPAELSKLSIKSVPSGTKVFDWTVPREWKITEAYIETETGERIVDFKKNNLHVMGYSTPVDRWVDLDELKGYIYTQPDQPDVIPYVTSYYKERFGFCMSEKQKQELKPGRYHMVIDSELFDGVLNYGEVIIPATERSATTPSTSTTPSTAQERSTTAAQEISVESKANNSAEGGRDEIFFSTYICHPSMANNECSGPALATALIKYVAAMPKRRYNYRFIFNPETIGSITYLATDNHLEQLQKHMVAGFNLSCVGDNRTYSIVESKYGNTLADRVLKNILRFHTNNQYSCYSFLSRGSDERQYNAPGIDLPVVCFCRSKFGEYPEYHTSADDMSLVSPEGFQGSYDVMTAVIEALEKGYGRKYKSTVLCEPQLGKRGLYPTVSQKGSYGNVKAMTDMIAYCDGKMDLIEISDKIGVSVNVLIGIAEKLKEHGLLVEDVENENNDIRIS